MARGINKAILIGNLGNDPETKYTQGGMAIINISLGTTSVRKDRDGNNQENTQWHRVTFFGIRWLGGWAQPIADGLKLLVKEIIVPTGANKFLFVLAPIMAIMPAISCVAWGAMSGGRTPSAPMSSR